MKQDLSINLSKDPPSERSLDTSRVSSGGNI